MATVSLTSLGTGSAGTVASVRPPQPGQDPELVLRLIEIGFLPGESVRVVARAQPGNDPIAVRLGRTTFALRRFEADFIQIEGH